MHDPADHDLIEHAQSLRGLARALVGAGDADDLVQDTAARALDQGPVETRSARGWLATMMRNLASNRRTADRRRRRREQTSGEGRPVEAPSALTAAARLETIDRLHAALRALPDPYREALLLRYFEGQTPNEIAALRSEPVATVKSRLRRGLEQLRQRLDDEAPRQQWRGAFVVAFGLGPLTPATAAVGLLTLGWILMSWKTLCGVAAAIAVSAWLWSDGLAAPPEQGHVPADPVVEVATATPGDGDALAREQVPVAAAPVDEPAEARSVTFVGRAVDEQQQPLAGVQARLEVRFWNGGDVAERATMQTGPDGRFELVATPRDEHRFEITLRVEQRLLVEADWREVDGDRVDLGDQLVPLPCVVRGRIVDEQGLAQPGAVVSIEPFSRGEKRALVAHSRIYSTEVVADENGAFLVDGTDALAPGPFALRDRSRAIVRPRGVWRVERGQRELTLEVVVAKLAPPCRGIVVDAAGSPVAGAVVSLGGASVTAGADGRFEVRARAVDPKGRYRVAANLAGWKRTLADWDGDPANTLRLTMAREPGLTLRVVDGDGKPIERFAVWLCPEIGWPFHTENDTAEHRDGIAQVRLGANDRLVCVEVPGKPERWSRFLPIPSVEGGNAELLVRVAPPLRRRVLLRAGDRPVAGANVDLVDRGGLEVTPAAERWPMRARRASGFGDARLVQRGVTDEQGAIWLEGPAGPLTLVVTGGGVPDQARPIDLRRDGEHVVTLSAGGTVRGRLGPPDVVQRLRALVRDRAERKNSRDLGLRMVRDGRAHPAVTRAPVAFDDEGLFEFALVPGTWQLQFDGFGRRTIAELVVAEGAVLERTFDVSAMDPAQLDLRIRVDGVPAANAYVNAMGTHDRDAFGRLVSTQSIGPADEHGALQLTTLPGELLLVISTRPSNGKGVQLQHVVPVAGPGPRTLDLQLQTAAVELRLQGPDGRALAGRDVMFGAKPWFSYGTTNADGVLVVEPLVAGTHPLYVWPPHLSERAARYTYERTNGEAALHAQRIRLEDFVVAPGQRASVTRVVPGG